MKTVNSLKKGTRVLLAYGDQNGDLAGCDDFTRVIILDFKNSSYKPWEAKLLDNYEDRPKEENGTIRFMKVFGWTTEMGDTYAHEVIAYKKNGTWHPVELSKEQKEAKALSR